MNREYDDTSTALIAAAREILDAYGSEGLTVRRIATRAGMSTMNVYSRFDGKPGVIDELFIDGYQRLLHRLEQVRETADSVQDVMDVTHAYRQFALENRSYYHLMFGWSTIANFEPSERAVNAATHSLTHFGNRIARCQQAGQIRDFPTWEPIEIGAWLWSMIHGLVSLELSSTGAQRIVWADQFERGIRTALDGIKTS